MTWEGIPLGLADMGPWGLLITVVAFVFVSLFRGWVVPKVHYEALSRRSDNQEKTIEVLRDTNGIQARTIEKQTAVGETVIKVVSSLQDSREGNT